MGMNSSSNSTVTRGRLVGMNSSSNSSRTRVVTRTRFTTNSSSNSSRTRVVTRTRLVVRRNRAPIEVVFE